MHYGKVTEHSLHPSVSDRESVSSVTGKISILYMLYRVTTELEWGVWGWLTNALAQVSDRVPGSLEL